MDMKDYSVLVLLAIIFFLSVISIVTLVFSARILMIHAMLNFRFLLLWLTKDIHIVMYKYFYIMKCLNKDIWSTTCFM